MRRTFPAVLVLFALAGCSGGAKAPGAAGDPPLCDPAVPATEVGALAVPAPGDTGVAPRTGAIALVTQGDCARVSLALPAGAVTGAAVLRSDGIVRVRLAGAPAGVADPDTVFDEDLVRAAYVVHGRDGSTWFDVHLAAPALGRFVRLAAPPRVAIDLAPGGGAVPSPAPGARNVVVLEPRAGAAAYPLVIRGYARTFEANVIARVLVDGQERAKTFGAAADYLTTWGEFTLTIAQGPAGPVQLFVGEDSAEDGSPRGVTIPLVMR